MLAARVVGTVVSTQKDERLDGLKLLLLAQIDAAGRETGAQIVAVDSVGAGLGETVLYATGSSARQTAATEGRPVDAVVMAIVDSWDINGEVKFRKE